MNNFVSEASDFGVIILLLFAVVNALQGRNPTVPHAIHGRASEPPQLTVQLNNYNSSNTEQASSAPRKLDIPKLEHHSHLFETAGSRSGTPSTHPLKVVVDNIIANVGAHKCDKLQFLARRVHAIAKAMYEHDQSSQVTRWFHATFDLLKKIEKFTRDSNQMKGLKKWSGRCHDRKQLRQLHLDIDQLLADQFESSFT